MTLPDLRYSCNCEVCTVKDKALVGEDLGPGSIKMWNCIKHQYMLLHPVGDGWICCGYVERWAVGKRMFRTSTDNVQLLNTLLGDINPLCHHWLCDGWVW
ncbi:hypothetical protein KIL84_000091 [Mauremys mutica]|uniref:Uncharacterized protein n=1 Tax=Mauremys mutica TaxID=74926 RepID=A0A9D3XGR6_9SAUR|nr:hypothetical protein KIL84_000091 [Mauremys mutica]